MLDRGKVSIITPMYNASEYISETIDSVVGQTYVNWELLITDDCSTDGSSEVVLAHTKKDKRIRLFKNSENSGPSESRNTSLSHASGRYIAFLDADDLWHPQKLEKQLDFMRSKGAILSYTSFHRFKEGEVGVTQGIPDKINYSSLLKNTIIATSTALIDTTNFYPVRMEKVYYDDFVLWLKILKGGVEAYGLKEDLMAYRVLSGSISRNKINSAKQVWITYREIEKINPFKSIWLFIIWTLNSFRKYRKF